MCLIKVKEEDDYSVPPRLVRRERKRSPPNSRRHSRVAYIQPPPQSVERTYIIQPPPPLPPPPAPEPEPVHHKSRTPSPAPVHVPEPTTQPHYVEVIPDSDSSASSDSEDARSRTTSKSRPTDARSEYHLREREYRRARGQSDPREDYEHYRYVRAPQERSSRERGGHGRDEGRGVGGRTSFIEDPGASRTSQRRERERVVIVDNDGRRTREYRR